MKKIVLFLIMVSSFIWIGCSTTESSVNDSSSTVFYNEESRILNKALRNITITSSESLTDAYNILQDSSAGISEYGQDLAYIAFKLLTILYPLSLSDLEEITPTTTSIYPLIFQEIENGRFPVINQEDFSFLSFLISPISLLFTEDPEVIEVCRETLDQIHMLNPGSIIPFYLSGYLYALEGNSEEALSSFQKAKEITGTCYPADSGIVSLKLEKHPAAALLLLDSLIIRFPENTEFLIQAASANFALGNLPEALDITTEILRTNPDDFSLLLLRAKILEAQGNYNQAKRLLNIIEQEKGQEADFLLIKANLLYAEEKIQESLDVLQMGIKLYPDNPLFKDAYGQRLLLTGYSEEGKNYLEENLESDPERLSSLRLLLEDAVREENWTEAGSYVERILAVESDEKDLSAAVRIFIELKQYTIAESYAELLYIKNNENIVPYVKILILNNKNTMAWDIIQSAFTTVTDSIGISNLYYLQSLVQTDPDEKLESLRSSLLENLLNIDAIITIARLHFELGDIRKAYRYMKQAVSLLPDDESLREEFSALEQRM